ncbi:MAG TPA: MJ0042-type zinc finger domain-containing protein [Planctomycetia bacterium]|nr:MJ0042-type zinc finger domain-containing protein [Planctomycetia bacterium]
MPEEALLVRCDRCGAALRVKDSGVFGKRIKCPKCGEQFLAAAPPPPEAETADEEEAPRTARAKAKGRAAPDEGDDDEPDDRPRKKKKKKAKRSAKKGNPLPLIIGGAVLALVLLVGGIIAIVANTKGGGSGKGGDAIAAFKRYESSAFCIDLPQGWELEDGGRENYKFVTVKKGEVFIKIQEDLVGSIYGEGGTLSDEKDPKLRPVQGIHLDKVESLKEDFGDGYSENEPAEFRCKLGEGRKSEFAVKGSWTQSALKGYRVSILGGAGKAWTMRPGFDRIIESVAFGKRT